MEETVGYQPEEPTKAPPEVNDWRLQEMYNMTPDAIMEELLGLSEEIHDSKLLHEEAKAELREAQERLKLMEAQVLQAALDSKDTGVSDQVKGKNAEERKRKADIYLADHPTVKQLAFEVKPLESLEAAARVAMETLLERSKNLHQWARMFEAQVRLLSTVRVPEPVEIRMTSEDLIAQISALAHREFVSEEDVLAAMTAGGVEIPYIGDEQEPDGARFVSEVDELFPPDVEIPPVSEEIVVVSIADIEAYVDSYEDRLAALWHKSLGGVLVGVTLEDLVVQAQRCGYNVRSDLEIPPSLGVLEEEVDDLKAAVERYQDVGEKVDESSGPSL